MKTTELMINDWVLYREEVLKVTSLYTKRGANEIGFGESENFWVDISNIEPIPLTSEILEKNGWETEYFGRRQEWWLDKTKFPIVRYSANDTLQHNGIVLKYVHQLQHALRLLGIEKEIEL